MSHWLIHQKLLCILSKRHDSHWVARVHTHTENTFGRIVVNDIMMTALCVCVPGEWDAPLWYTSVLIYFFFAEHSRSDAWKMNEFILSETETSRCLWCLVLRLPRLPSPKNNYVNFDSEFYWILRCSHIMFGSVTNVQSFLVIIAAEGGRMVVGMTAAMPPTT